MLLRDLLAPERIRIPIFGRDKQAVIQELVGLAIGAAGAAYDDALRAVEARESVLSTGIGYGVAIPHGKSSLVGELRLAAGASRLPVAFDALDGLPANLFFLLIGPPTVSADHVQALARISRLVRREPLRNRLLAALDAGDFYRALCDAESR